MSDSNIKVDLVETAALVVEGNSYLIGPVETITAIPEDPTNAQLADAIRELQLLLSAKGLAGLPLE